jgi:hypothetical protein
MTDVAVTHIAMAALTSGQSATTGVQPTTQQVARFEQQLQAPGAAEAQFYQAPVTATSAGNLQGVMGDVGKLAEQYRVDTVSLDGAPLTTDVTTHSHAADTPAGRAELFQQNMTKLTHMSYTMMSIGFVTSTERMAGENVRSLFQLS